MKKKELERSIEILNDVSVVLECYIATEYDKQRLKDLDYVIDLIYNELAKKTNKGVKNG